MNDEELTHLQITGKQRVPTGKFFYNTSLGCSILVMNVYLYNAIYSVSYILAKQVHHKKIETTFLLTKKCVSCRVWDSKPMTLCILGTLLAIIYLVAI